MLCQQREGARLSQISTLITAPGVLRAADFVQRVRGGDDRCFSDIASSFTRFWLFLAVWAPSTCLAQAVLPQAGCAEWHRASALTLQGKVQEGGLDGRFTLLLDPRDGRNTVSRDFGVFSESSGFNGRVGWSQDRSGGSHDLNAEAAGAISTTESWILRRGWCGVHDVAVEPMPDESDAGAALSVWRVTPKDGVPTILRFDRHSGLLRQ